MSCTGPYQSDTQFHYIGGGHVLHDPPLHVHSALMKRGFSTSSSKKLVGRFGLGALGTGGHGFYGATHFVELFKSAGLFRRGNVLVGLQDMERVLKHHRTSDGGGGRILEELIDAGLTRRPASETANVVSTDPSAKKPRRNRTKGGMKSFVINLKKRARLAEGVEGM